MSTARRSISVIVMRASGGRTPVTIEGNVLEALQAEVGGFIEQVSIPDHRHLCFVVNEEGALRGDLPFNLRASLIAGRRIVGTAVLVKRADL